MKGSNDNHDSIMYFSGSQAAPASRTRNVTIGGVRSTIRLEEAFWEALEEILKREGLTLNDLVTRISDRQSARGNLSSAVRVFIHSYFYALSQDRTPRLPRGAAWKAHKPRNRDSIQDPE
ncbi:ribbon-helix-helix domain-containing protein [Inquilinus sp. OTU3971]|uniref:ribbon-helix-helix domain-containing protein n=1 Tax=Inquilinus sp. OTU3971 TaxID=3043855 RepID=UPI00313F36D4